MDLKADILLNKDELKLSFNFNESDIIDNEYDNTDEDDNNKCINKDLLYETT